MKSFVLAVAAIAAITGSSGAQGVQTGSIAGVVRSSPDNLPFPGATITATSPALQGEQTIVSDESGAYIFRGLAPGPYTLRVEVEGMAPGTETVQVLLGRESRMDLTIAPAALTERVVVAAAPPPVLSETRAGMNLSFREIDRLPTPRSLSGIALLAPGVNDATPNAAEGQIGIAGSFGYDSSFMVNGVEVNDNVLGYAHNLFIEEAILETQVLTASIPAEYGRFTGGVVNAVTKQGGNTFSGSFRANLTNTAWSTETPFERAAGETRTGDLAPTYEGTVGGPAVRDRLWFFGAGRKGDTSTDTVLPQTGLPFKSTSKNDRLEIKLTGTPAANHTIEGGYLRNNSEFDRTAFAFSIDPHTADQERRPNNHFVASYRGVLMKTLFGQFQYSQKKFSVLDRGGTATDLAESPFINFANLGHYNAPFFDERDPEKRDNRQVTGSVSWSPTRAPAGRHDVKAGFETFTTSRTGGNSQSPTNNVYWANYKTDAAGQPVYDASGRLIPTFPRGGALLDVFFPQLGAKLDITTTSFYIQDSWRPSAQWTLNLGTRFEHVGSRATGGGEGISANTIVPRLAASYDVRRDGRLVLQGSYSQYAGKYSEALFGANTNVGTPDEIFGVYTGPSGEGRDFAPGLDADNYVFFYGAFPTKNISLATDIHSPVTREVTMSVGAQIGQRGYGKATYLRRRLHGAVEDFVSLENGSTHVVAHDIDFGEFPNIVYRNTDAATREYDAVQLQARYDIRSNWGVTGTWSIELQNDGNFEGEAANRPGLPSVIGNYPELFTSSRHYPAGHLDDFQRHRARIWSAYQHGLGRYGSLGIAGLVRVNSARTYSLAAANQGLSAVQAGLGAAYVTLPEVQDVFFDRRGSERFKGYAVTDVSVDYQVPVLGTVRPWLKVDVFNVFDNRKLISWNATVRPDGASVADSLGLPTGYVRGPRFGEAESPTNYPSPYPGATGGRTFQVALGFRF